MFQLDILLDTSVIPPDFMELRDDDFLAFVKKEAGDAAAALLDIQGINCVKSLLMTEDVYSVMDMKSKSLEEFKNKHGFLKDDDSFIIWPGIKGNMDCSIDLLKRECIEHAKSLKSSKHRELSTTVAPESTPSAPWTCITNTVQSISSKFSVDDHKAYIIDTLNKWVLNNKEMFNLQQFSLIEGVHYSIRIQNGLNRLLKWDIKCCCGNWSSLPLRRQKFQLSNFYRHLQRLNGLCPDLKQAMNGSQLVPISTTTTTTTTDASQLVVSKNKEPATTSQDEVSNSRIPSDPIEFPS